MDIFRRMTVSRALRRSSRSHVAGIMPNAAASDVPRLHDRRALRARHRRVRRSGAVLRPGTDGRRRRRLDALAPEPAQPGQDVILVVVRARMEARRPLGRRQSLRLSRAPERDGRVREDDEHRPASRRVRSSASLSAGVACRTSAWATSSRTRPSGSGRRPDSGWRSDRCASCSGGYAIIATASKRRRKPAPGDRGPQLRRHDRLFRPRAIARSRRPPRRSAR